MTDAEVIEHMAELLHATVRSAYFWQPWVVTPTPGTLAIEVSSLPGRDPWLQRVGLVQAVSVDPDEGQLVTVLTLNGETHRWANSEWLSVPSTWMRVAKALAYLTGAPV